MPKPFKKSKIEEDSEEIITNRTYNNRVNLSGFSIDYLLWLESEHVRKSIGLTEKEWLRFCIANTVLNIKHSSIKVHLSKEYIEKLTMIKGVEVFDRLKETLEKMDVPVQEVE
jgi:hypothetical protein